MHCISNRTETVLETVSIKATITLTETCYDMRKDPQTLISKTSSATSCQYVTTNNLPIFCSELS